MLSLGQLWENIHIPKYYLPNSKPLFWRHLAAYNFASTYVKNKIVLDIGCGEGYGAALLARKANWVMGMDKNPERINLARTQYSSSKLTFLESDILDSDFEEQTFDVVVAMQVIEHIPNPDAFFRKVAHILKPEGVFLVSTPNKKQRLKVDEKPFNPEHVREYEKDEFGDLLALFFSKINVVGIVGNYEANKWEHLRLNRNLFHRLARKVLKFDFWNLRYLIPDDLRRFIIQGGGRARKSLGQKISLESYNIKKKNIEEALDFVGICKIE